MQTTPGLRDGHTEALSGQVQTGDLPQVRQPGKAAAFGGFRGEGGARFPCSHHARPGGRRGPPSALLFGQNKAGGFHGATSPENEERKQTRTSVQLDTPERAVPPPTASRTRSSHSAPAGHHGEMRRWELGTEGAPPAAGPRGEGLGVGGPPCGGSPGWGVGGGQPSLRRVPGLGRAGSFLHSPAPHIASEDPGAGPSRTPPTILKLLRFTQTASGMTSRQAP